MIATALTRALRVSAVGITLGAIAGLSSLVLADAQATARFAGLLFLFLPLAAVLATLVLTLNDLRAGEQQHYASLGSALALLLLQTAAAVTLASLLYYTLALNLPVFLRGYDGALMGELLAARLGLGRFLAVLGLSLFGAATIALWARSRAA